MALFLPPEQLKQRLVQEGLVTPERFDALAAEAGRKGQGLIDILASEHIADTNYLYAFAAELLGVERANLANQAIDEAVVRSLPEEIARQREVIIFQRDASGAMLAAMSDPSDLETIEFLTQRLKVQIIPLLATADDLNRGFMIYGSRSTEDFKKIIEENIQASLRAQTKSSEEAATELPIVAITDSILSYAVAERASDIHVEILEDTTMVRYRVDGILYEIIRIPKIVHNALVARIKILSGLKIDEHYRPQDGRFRYQIVNQTVDVRVSIMPTFYGEKIEMRLLESTQKPMSLEELGILPATAQVVAEGLRKSFGMIIVCGPTGSGKTTTLYALLNMLNKPNVNIVSIEDPIEYNMRYVNQSQINPQSGITFASGLRALLRQDPNIVLVGEIRDVETANIAVQAALTGHLLLSSLHTNDAPTAIPRLFDLQVQPFLVASTLNLIVAQRLVRRICPTCIVSEEPSVELQSSLREQLEQLKVPDFERLIPKVVFHGKGCASCANTGYRSRLGIYEVIQITDSIRRLIVEPNFSLQNLNLEVRRLGLQTMFEDGLEKVQLGVTTIDEVMRVIKE